MAAYRRVYGFGHLRADCRAPGSAPEPYARVSSIRVIVSVSDLIIQFPLCTMNVMFLHFSFLPVLPVWE